MTMTMQKCLIAHRTVAKEDLAAIKERVASYVEHGVDEHEAEIIAVRDVLAEAKAEGEEIVAAVKDQYRDVLESVGRSILKEKADKEEQANRPRDAKGNPIFKQGERVEFVSGEANGRHGEVVVADRIRTVSIGLSGVFGGERTEEVSYQYTVKTDGGATFHASPWEIRLETARPETTIPDIEIDGGMRAPDYVLRSINYAKQSAEKSRASAQRARKPDMIQQHKREAERNDTMARAYQTAFDAWAQKYPEAAAQYAPPQRVAAALPTAQPKVSGDMVKAAGLAVTKTTTKTGKPVWEVGGNTKAHADLLKRLGGRWYGPRKVWSFYNDDPTKALAEKLGGQVAARQVVAPVVDATSSTIMGQPVIDMSDARLQTIANSAIASAETKAKAQEELAAREEADNPVPQSRIDAIEIVEAPQAGRWLVREKTRTGYQNLATFALSDAGTPQRVNNFFEAEQTREPIRQAIERWANARKMNYDGGKEAENGKSAVSGNPVATGATPDIGLESRTAAGDGASDRQDGDRRSSGGESLAGGVAQDSAADGSTGDADRVSGSGNAEVGSRQGVRDGEPVGGGDRKPTAQRDRPESPPTDVDLSGKADFQISDEDAIGDGSQKTKARNNLAAIRLLKMLDAEDRKASPQEQKTLAKYVGWGGIKQIFDDGKKDWAKERAELKALLTEEEYAAARRSMLDAHYTSTEVVTGMWAAAQHLGFTGGRVLEPSVGVGNFFGLMPADLRAKSGLFGVELDNITAALARNLYPSAQIANKGFEDVKLPTGAFDFVIGNPPFGSVSLFDKDHPELRSFNIHQFFFAKSLDKLRPGGVMQLVVSRYLMDASDATGFAAREYLGQRAKLLGAIRLPFNAFLGNANTEVVTDIIFLQKLNDGEASNAQEWMNVDSIETTHPKTGEKFAFGVNRYFHDHPDMVLGDQVPTGKMYGHPNGYNVAPREGDSLFAALQGAIAKLPANVITPAKQPLPELMKPETIVPEGTKVMGYYVNNGVVMQRMPDAMGTRQGSPVQFKDDKAPERAKAMIRVRDALRELMRAELSDTPLNELDRLRAQLNRVYDGFVGKYGYIRSPVNRRAFNDDPDLPLLESLETDYDAGIGKDAAAKKGIPARAAKAGKADIFSTRVLEYQREVTSAATAQDALLASLNMLGGIDPEYMAGLYGKPWDEIRTELGSLIFHDPNGGWETADTYLSGNVKAKLKMAQEAAAKDDQYKANVEALQAVIPADLTPLQISVKLGSPWVPGDVIELFAKELWGVTNASIRFIKQLARWNVSAHGGDSTALNATWGVTYQNLDKMPAIYPADKILEAVANNKAVTIRENIGTSEQPVWHINEPATEAIRAKAQDMADKFKEWIWQDADRRDRLAKIYNDNYNTDRQRVYDGSHMTLPGLSKAITMRLHQLNAIWRAIQDRVILLDHSVGAGKTLVMIATVMEMRRLGIARKPIIVVPNHLVQQWRDEFYRAYPSANVLAATEADFAKNNRKRFMAKIATGDWDAVIVAQSSFKRIGMPEETQSNILNDQLTDITDAIEDMKRERGDKNVVRDMEKIKRAIEAKIKSLKETMGKKDDTVTFDELGADALFVDEAHLFKNLFFYTQMQRVAGLGSPSGSGRAFDMFVKIQYLNERYAGRPVINFATGTPVSNSLVEMFTMQRYLSWNKLKDQGLHLLDAWAGVYGDVQNVYEVHPSGTGYRIATRFAKFVNMPSLMSGYRSFADVVTIDDLKRQAKEAGGVFPVPKIKGGKPRNIVASRSDFQARFFGVPEFARTESGEIDFQYPSDLTVARDGKTGQWYPATASGAKVGQEGFASEAEASAERDLLLRQPIVRWNNGSILDQYENLRELTKQSEGKINALSITNQARKAGLDYRLIDPDAPDYKDSKINLAVDEINRIYKAWDKDKGTQLVFCDMSVPKSAREKAATQERKAFIRDAEGILNEVKATVVAIKGIENAFLSVKHGKGEKIVYSLHDGVSGMPLGIEAAKKADAIAALQKRIEEDGLLRFVEDLQERYGEISEGDIADYRDAHEQEAKDDEEGEGAISLSELSALASGGSFSVYDDIKAKLVLRGVKPAEIAFIHDYDTAAKKNELYKLVRSGDVRILIGSTEKMGAGMNVQDRLVALHHLDAPWKPSDLEQREGRIVRQGNKLYERDPEGFEVEIMRYGTRQTYDTRMWQILEHKASGIEQLRKAGSDLLELEDIGGEAANAADMKAAASGNPLILDEIKLRNEVKTLEAQQFAHLQARIELQNKAAWYQKAPERAEERIGAVQWLIDTAANHPVEPFAITLSGKKYADKKDIATPLTEAFKKTAKAEIGALVPVGSYRGLELVMERNAGALTVLGKNGEHSHMLTRYTMDDKFSPSGLLTRLDNAIDGAALMAQKWREDAAAQAKQVAKLTAEADKPFAKNDDLKQARAEHRAVVSKLRKSGGGIELTLKMREELDAAIAKRLGGPQGAQAGDTAALFSRNTSGGIHADDLHAVVQRASKAFPGLPMHVLESERQAPKALRDDIREAGAQGDVAGALHNGEVYLFAPGLRDVAHAERTIVHEATHAGLRRMFGESMNPVLLDIHKSNLSVQLKAAKIKAKYGYSLARSVDEALADMGAEATKLAGWGKLVAWVRGKLRNAGFVSEWTDNDIAALLLNALDAARKPADHIVRGSAFAGAREGYTREAFASNFLKELAASEPDVFRYPTSSAATLQGVFRDVFPGVEYFGEHTRVDEKSETGADHRFVFATPESKDGKKGKQFNVYTTDAGRVWIDVQHLQPGDQGSRIYHAVANYAHNARKVFGGDPVGVSPDAIIARMKMMLASILRFGTAKHLDASREQEKGIPSAGIEPLDWRGSDVEKLRSLIHTFVTTATNRAPRLNDFHYDFQKRGFFDRSGNPVSRLQLLDATRAGQSGASGIGADSGRAAILIKSLVSAESRGIGDAGILQALLNDARALVDGGLGGVFSRDGKFKPVDVASPEFKQWFGDSKVVDDKGRPLRVYHGTPHDFSKFKISKNGIFGRGVYFSTNPHDADDYTYVDNDSAGSIMPVYLSIQRPFKVDFRDTWADVYAKLIGEYPRNPEGEYPSRAQEKEMFEALDEMGHDGFEIYGAGDKGTSTFYIAHYKQQIKSALSNTGEYGIENGDIRFSRSTQGATDVRDRLNRIEEILRRKASGETIADTLIRVSMQTVGIDKATRKVGQVVRSIADKTPEYVKAGIVSDYGIPEEAIDQRNAMFGHQRRQLRGVSELLDRMAGMSREESRVAYEWLNNRDADHLIEALPEQSRIDLMSIKQQIDALGREAVGLGLLSADAYEAHKMAYVHRSYRKWDIEATPSEKKSRARAKQILGDQFKTRGLSELAKMENVKNTNPSFWKRKLRTGKADQDLRGVEFIRFERRGRQIGTGSLEGMGEDAGLGKLLEVQYWPKDEPVPARYGAWHEAGTFTVRGTKGDKLVMHRDWTKAERERMGEIDEARYAIAKTFHQMIHDIEVAKYLRWVAGKYGKTEAPHNVRVVEAREAMRATFGKDDWVQVPIKPIHGTSVLKYGALSGLYIPGPIWNDIRQVVNYRYQPLGETYAGILRAWKISRTALSPGVHTNNVMANFVMADWHDVRAHEVLEAVAILVQQGKKPEYKELLDRFEDAGGTQGMYILSEIQREQLEPVIEQLRAEVDRAGELQGMVGVSAALQAMMHGKIKDAYEIARASRGGRGTAFVVHKMMDLYQFEDTMFRLAAFIKAKRNGATDLEAGKIARTSFLDYQINAPWIQIMRQTAFPFISFTYRAVPMLLKTIETKPWKLAKLMLFAGLLNAFGYALSGGDEDEERRYLPNEKAGRLWGIVPKLIRIPWNDEHDSPVFLDVRRWVPVGDVIDTGATHAAVPLIPAAIPGGPLALMAELLFNKSQFTGKEIVKGTDTGVEAAQAVVDHLYKAFAPNIFFLPGTYSNKAVMDAGTGRTDVFGREQSVGMALASSVGFKVSSYPLDVMRRNAGLKVNGDLFEIRKGMYDLGRERARGGLSDAEYNNKLRKQIEKYRDRVDEFNRK